MKFWVYQADLMKAIQSEVVPHNLSLVHFFPRESNNGNGTDCVPMAGTTAEDSFSGVFTKQKI